MSTILFLTADPTNTARLRLQEELRDIRESLRQANFQLEYAFSVRPGDISQAIPHFEPHIVHFSRHGTSTGELCLEDESGTMQPVKPKALAALFELVADQVNCVVLNACYSDIQAKAVVKHIPFVIGMKQAISDQAASAFAVGFYKRLGKNGSIEDAFKSGCVEIQLQSLAEELTPVLHKKEDNRPAGIYVERLVIEKRCYEAIKQPGSLIRIQAPKQMGKTSLMNRIVTYAIGHNYQTVTLSCRELVNETVSTDLEKFLRLFCITVTKELGLSTQLDEYWDEQATANDNSKNYFQKYLLVKTDSPLVLALNDVDRVFEQPKIANDFCQLLRTCHELAKRGDSNSKIWKKLRLIIVHSTEVYASLDINNSPITNVGLVVDLPEFSPEQVQRLVRRHRLSWTTDQIAQLMAMVGGHPFLLRTACDYVKLHQITFEKLLQVAPSVAGPFSDHLLELLKILEKNPELKAAFTQVISADEDNPVQLNPMQAKSLQRLGLVKLEEYFAKPRCELYRQYFGVFL